LTLDPFWTEDAVAIVFAAMAFQSSTASARAMCDQLSAASGMRGDVITKLLIRAHRFNASLSALAQRDVFRRIISGNVVRGTEICRLPAGGNRIRTAGPAEYDPSLAALQ
jgi:hypothetical protein